MARTKIEKKEILEKLESIIKDAKSMVFVNFYGLNVADTTQAREVYEFQKKYKNSISILGGVFDGKFMSKEEMMGIALIPSQKTLHAMFVNVINSPIQGFVMALDQISKKKAQ